MTHPAIRHLDAAEAALERVAVDIGPDAFLIQARQHLARVREECVREAVGKEKAE